MAVRRRQFTITFGDSSGLLDARQFGRFIELFSELHNAMAREGVLPADDADLQAMNSGELRAHFLGQRRQIARICAATRGKLEDPGRLVIRSVSKASPLLIVMAAIPAALAIAVIFSGGEINMTGFRAKLPPLGVGVKSLRDALGQRTARSAPTRIASKKAPARRKGIADAA